MSPCPLQQTLRQHDNGTNSSAERAASFGKSVLRAAMSSRSTVASARRARPRAKHWRRRRRLRLMRRNSFRRKLARVMWRLREKAVVEPYLQFPKTRSRSPLMNFKSGSVRAASLFGRLAVLALTSPAVRFGIRAVTTAANVAVTVARRFVHR